MSLSTKEMHRGRSRLVGRCRNIACLCRDGVSKAKAKLELNLAMEVEDKKESFHIYTDSKRKWAHYSMRLGTQSKECILDAFLASVFTSTAHPQALLA